MMRPQTTTTLRPYQQRAYDSFKDRSGIIVLPTGSGKTLIAVAVALNHLRSGAKVLFLVPTCLLVNQQATALRYETGGHYSIAEYMGGVGVPKSFDAIVSTPAAFISLIAHQEQFHYRRFSLVIFDEIHHVIKRHTYRTIARHLREIEENSGSNQLRILGLTASLTYAIGASTIKRAVEELCADLRMSGDCLFTATTEELITDGYHGNTASQVDVRSDLSLSEDGRQSLEIPGRPHEALADLLRHVTERLPPIHDLSVYLMDVIHQLEVKIKQEWDSSFVSPIGVGGKRGRVAAWGEYANQKYKSHLRKHQNASRAYYLLEHLYEAARLVANSRQGALELAMRYLEMYGILKLENQTNSDGSGSRSTYTLQPWEISLLAPLEGLWNAKHSDFCRLTHLKEVILQQFDSFENSLRGIIFVQQRVTTHILQHFIMSDEDLNFLACDVVYATSSPATASLSISPSQSRERLSRFGSGLTQILISTAVSEEGMDVPAANCVIRFDPVQTPVSLVQSRGRARQDNSAFVVLREQPNRSVESLEQAEKQQRQVISTINERGIGPNLDLERQRAAAQRSRIQNAKGVLIKYFAASASQQSISALGTLNNYAQKIKGELTQMATPSATGSGFNGTISLDQYGAPTIIGNGKGNSKTEVLQAAALDLLRKVHNRQV